MTPAIGEGGRGLRPFITGSISFGPVLKISCVTSWPNNLREYQEQTHCSGMCSYAGVLIHIVVGTIGNSLLGQNCR